MELVEAIKTRRSIRKYKDNPIPGETLRELLELATWAPTGMNMQPWAFVVVEDREYLKDLSDRSKTILLEKYASWPGLERYRLLLSDPSYNIFYNAPVLVMIYGDRNVLTFENDCSMAAQNLMLAARNRGIGSCWIGFANSAGNSPEVKKELNVPEHYELVAPVVLGYPDGPPRPVDRRPPDIITWRR